MKLSIIIPTYNAKGTIIRCLDSIYSVFLDESDFEVICVDDCSQDNTVDIIQRYSSLHPNIILLVQSENHRQGAARNRGLSITKGEYIIYLDSDDELDNGVINALEIAEKYKLDLVAMHHVFIDSEGVITQCNSIDLNGIFTGKELQIKHPFWRTAPWSYLYDSSFLRNINYSFAEDVLFEDSDYVNVHLCHAQRMMYCLTSCYRVHYNSNSVTHTQTYKHLSDYLLLGRRMFNLYNSLTEKDTIYADSIKEGASYNVWIACKRLFKLSSIRDVKMFYDRVDQYIDRSSLLIYNDPRYCWTKWTRLSLKSKQIAILILFIGQLVYKLKHKLQKI